jgi:RimJ/RimL family protein N-acetyltransferase
MIELQTERLRLVALDREHLRLLLDNPDELCRRLGIVSNRVETDEEVRSAREEMYAGTTRCPEGYYWYTEWQIIYKEENSIVGSFCFKGAPNELGEVEVSYRTAFPYRSKGFMTEAMRVVATWVFKNAGVTALIAETPKDNVPSHRVLQKIGMEIVRESSTSFWWRLRRRS